MMGWMDLLTTLFSLFHCTGQYSEVILHDMGKSVGIKLKKTQKETRLIEKGMHCPNVDRKHI